MIKKAAQIMRSGLAIAGVATLLALTSHAAQARGDVSWSIGVNTPGVSVGVGNGYGYPVYVAPQPVYVQPRPIYYSPPAPVYYAPPRPIYYAPPVYVPAPGYYYGGNGHRGRGHGHGHRRDRD